MKTSLTASIWFPLLIVSAVACAEGVDGDSTDAATGGTDGSGGLTSGSGGGLIGSSGGSTNSGPTPTGGATATGGSSATGGSASGGAATGGTGGQTFDGQCAGKPSFDAWKVGSSQATGDEVVYTCTVAQAGCSAATLNEPSLFSCNQSHVPNCSTQAPRDGSSWTLIGACSDGGVGGAAP
jgi:hypothetical protein